MAGYNFLLTGYFILLICILFMISVCFYISITFLLSALIVNKNDNEKPDLKKNENMR